MQGIVLQTEVKSDNGIICTDDGARFPFKMQDAHGIAVCGTTVEFSVTEGKACDVFVRKMPWSARLDWLFWFLFSFRGRISRDQFVWYLVGMSVVMPFAIIAAFLTAEAPDMLFVFGFFPAILLWTKICVITKRFHDTNRSGGWLWTIILFSAMTFGVLHQPYFNDYLFEEVAVALLSVNGLLVLFGIWLCFSAGNICDNKYGKEPYVCVTKILK